MFFQPNVFEHKFRHNFLDTINFLFLRHYLFSICYYYYHYYFIASWLWFLTYIYSNFANKFFGLSNLELFVESLYASNIYLHIFLLFFLSFFKFFLYIYFYYYNYHHYYCLYVLYVHRACWETYKISSRFESCFVLVF